MSLQFEVTVGAELPDWQIHWQDGDGNTIDLSGAWTFTLRVGHASGGVLEKTSGITGDDADPNITVTWAAGDWDDVDPGIYQFTITARRTSDNKDRVLRGVVRVLSAIPAPSS